MARQIQQERTNIESLLSKEQTLQRLQERYGESVHRHALGRFESLLEVQGVAYVKRENANMFTYELTLGAEVIDGVMRSLLQSPIRIDSLELMRTNPHEATLILKVRS